MSKALLSFLGTSLFVLSGCSGTDLTSNVEPSSEAAASEAPSVAQEKDNSVQDFAIQKVKDRFEADCFSFFGDSFNYVYKVDQSGTNRDGFVYVTVDGNVFQFAVGTTEAGAFLTVPHTSTSQDLLEKSGC